MDSPDISVYGEAKGEYTRQLCVYLVPCLESYFLELLETAKEQSPSPQKILWQFQTLMQSIPDWNQDKVLHETERIQKDCKCDYLEELLTAVFIAHTKVLSAIRLTTKQKKLQITIPKMDHFLHRVLSDSARSLWTNAFLFAETNSIEKQKNLRQVAALLHEAVLQGIRGLLPVKSILREYLHDDDDAEDKEDTPKETPSEDAEGEKEKDKEEVKPEESSTAEDTHKESPSEVAAPPALEPVNASPVEDASGNDASAGADEGSVAEAEASAGAGAEAINDTPVTQASENSSPMIYIDTKPSVSFSQEHIMFDSDNLENNEIHDIPFAEAELREDSDDEENEIDSIELTNDVLSMDADEILA